MGSSVWFLALAAAANTCAQTKPDITKAWNSVLADGSTVAAGSVVQPPAAGRESQARDLVSHFFLESRTEVMRQQISFSGLPTLAGFLPAMYPGPFDPGATTLYQTLNFGTRGWMSPCATRRTLRT